MGASDLPDDRYESLQAELRLTRDQVDLLQIQTAEKKKPWYRQTALLMSLIALLFSTAFNAASVRDRTIAVEKAKVEELNKILLDLVNLQEQQLQDVVLPNNPASLQRNAWRNGKRQLLLETANAIVEQIPGKVSPNALGQLAWEHFADGRYATARDLYEKALNESRDSTLTTVTILQNLGLLYATPGTGLQDMSKARSFWKRSTANLAHRQDPYGQFLQVNDYLKQEWTERRTGAVARADSLLRNAARVAEELPREHPMRDQLRQQVQAQKKMEEAFQKLGDSNETTAGDPDDVLGRWKITYPESPTLVGTLYLMNSPQPGIMSITGEISEGERTVKKLFGSAVMLGPNEVRIDWNGSVVSALGPAMATGAFTLKRRGHDTMSGSELVLGYPTTRVRFHR